METLRDSLRDNLAATKMLNEHERREELYWATYNAGLVVMRIARWLRLHGFGATCIGPIGWLVQSVNACLPLMAIHMIPFRMCLLQELQSGEEAARQLLDGSRVCDVALEHIKSSGALESMVQPVPDETLKILDDVQIRSRILKIEYEYLLAPGDVNRVIAKAEELGPDSQFVLPCLTEMLQIQHGLSRSFTVAPGAPCVLESVAPTLPEAPPSKRRDVKDANPVQLAAFTLEAELLVTHFGAETLALQAEVLSAVVGALQQLLQKIDAAGRLLEERTAKRLAYDTASNEETRETPNTSESLERPDLAKPGAAELEKLGFDTSTGIHTLEDRLPLAAHLFLLKECSRYELWRARARLPEVFELLVKGFVIRYRYRHFLCPPLMDLDSIFFQNVGRFTKT